MASISLPDPRARRWMLTALCAIAGLAVGALAALINPLVLIGVIAGALVGLWLIGSVSRALFALVVVIGVLPRFALPARLGFTPTFLDLVLVGLAIAWVLHQLGPRRDLPLRRIPITLPVLTLALVALATFIIGLPNGALTPLVLRRFAELVLSLLACLLIAALLPDLASQEQLVRWMLVIGGLSAAVGIALYIAPDDLAMRALSALRPFGYPTGPGVLRFIRDDPQLMQRATGLWIDPNAFGGYLLVVGALGLPQLFSPRPVMRRWLIGLCLLLICGALVLTVSRGAMLGLALVAAAIGALRYRRLLFLMMIVLALVLVLPQTRDLVQHFAEGLQGRDLATQMRFGEYKDALRLIERYPVLGVGFVGTPDVDLYIGVSSMYLLIAQQMGLLGLAVFVSVFIVLFGSAIRAWPAIARDARAEAVFFGAHGAVLGVLFSGIFDHYFFNIDFHNSVMLFWMMIALAASSQRLSRDRSVLAHANPQRDAIVRPVG
ncbi:MAG: O-antigen ligase family protein [Thermoflexales bacterium]|nr:O-antigen ligase family protein [Thermoflexales bacterium]MDW8351802.1 O-antigen ligase family protein [Anaerolineae bacterium]